MHWSSVTTAEQLLHLPPEAGLRHELVRGELRRVSPAGFPHGVVESRINRRLADVVESRALGVVCGGETGFLLARDPDTVLAPDVAFVAANRLADPIRGYFPGPPDLAVEVVSPNESAPAVRAKALAWLDHGTRLVWVAHPIRRTVTVYRAGKKAVVLAAEDQLHGDDVVPGFTVRVGDLFPSPSGPI